MNHSLVTADRTTHLKIVAVSLVAAIAVILVGVTARITDTGTLGEGRDPTALCSRPASPRPSRRAREPQFSKCSVFLEVTSASPSERPLGALFLCARLSGPYGFCGGVTCSSLA